MRHKWLALSGVVAIVVIACLACPSRLTRFRTGPDRRIVTLSPGRYGETYRTEQEWIAWQIVSRIAAVAASAGPGRTRAVPPIVVKTRPAPEIELFNHATLDVSIGGKPVPSIVVYPHLWSPEPYVALARALLRPRAPKACENAGWRELFVTLTEPRINTILDEEARVSAELRCNPADAAAHEEAALLFATLALREAASEFTDTRIALARTTAHLALSRALGRSEPGANAQIAGAIASALVGREDLAIPAIDRFASLGTEPALAAWKAALRLRVTGDWREMEDHASRSLLERLEYARAVEEHGGFGRTAEVVDEVEGDRAADWHRIIVNSEEKPSFTVETGNRLVDAAREIELHEMAEVWRRYHEGEPTSESLMASLGQDAGASDHVIEWSTWAGFLERHFCAHLAAVAIHSRMLGVDEEREEWRKVARPSARLVHFPFVLMKAATNEAQFRAAVAEAIKLPASHPELFTARLADLVRSNPGFLQKPVIFSSDFAWFTPFVPTGTRYEVAARSQSPNCPRIAPVEQVSRWAGQAPHDSWAQWSLAWRSVPADPTFADTWRALAAVRDYDLRASLLMFRNLRATSDEYLSAARLACQIDANECEQLAGELLFAGREREAAAAYEHYFRDSRDRVGVSNGVWWFVRYAWDTGRRDLAATVAEDAGCAASEGGLGIYAEVLERQGREEEARAVLERVKERYGESGWGLAAYYLRKARETGDEQWVRRAAQAVPKIFPAGIERARATSFSGPPADGIRFHSFGPRARRTGLRPEDIIVAVDGYRVRNFDQFGLITKSGFRPKALITVWRTGRYQDLSVNMPQRYMAVLLSNHPAPDPNRRIVP